jgi:hypothetical protein
MPVTLSRESYWLGNSLNSGTEDAPTPPFQIFEPGQAYREELLLGKLGVRGWGRLHYFRQVFSGAWGEGKEKPLSPRAMEAFFEALEKISFPQGSKPSIFLTDDGNLELAWRDELGNPVQLEFGPQETEIFIESRGVEKTFPNRDIGEVVVRYLEA